MELVYNILSEEAAAKTLEKLTSVPFSTYFSTDEQKYEYTEDMIEDIAARHGHLPPHYENWNFIYTHITTSANHCESFTRNGVMDLVQSYSCPDSELRTFLDSHGIIIDLLQKQLQYQHRIYDISYTYGEHIDLFSGSEKSLCRAIARKFFFDFTSCGFLSVWDKHPYGGRVHVRPEILQNIDDLLRTNLSDEWASTHLPYEIIIRIKGDKILYDSDADQSEKEKDIHYLVMAYNKALGDVSETTVLLKDHVSIPASDIVDIKPLTYWKL